VLSFEKLVLESIVLELLELLEGLQRSTHDTMISPNRLSSRTGTKTAFSYDLRYSRDAAS
jgi:hypothetical protein